MIQMNALSFRISSWLQLGRTFSFSHGARHRDVGQFVAIDCATQQQSATAHVPAPDEIRRKAKPVPQMREKNVDVFSGRDASKQDDFAICRQFLRELFQITLERSAITRIVFIDIHLTEVAQILDPDRCRRRDPAMLGAGCAKTLA